MRVMHLGQPLIDLSNYPAFHHAPAEPGGKFRHFRLNRSGGFDLGLPTALRAQFPCPLLSAR